jgi:hypothetical protein
MVLSPTPPNETGGSSVAFVPILKKSKIEFFLSSNAGKSAIIFWKQIPYGNLRRHFLAYPDQSRLTSAEPKWRGRPKPLPKSLTDGS